MKPPPQSRRPPTLVPAPAERLPRAERVATPSVRTLLGYTRRVLSLDGGNRLAVFSFSSAAEANWLFLIDSKTLRSERYLLPRNDIGSHGAALGADGAIYVMPYGNGRAYRFDPATRRFTPCATDLPSTEYTWEAFGAKNGRIYFGTYPSPFLGEYDPAADRARLFPQAAPNTKYITHFSEEADGSIRCKAWGPDEIWLRFDPQKGTLTRTDAPAPAASDPLPPAPSRDDVFSASVSVGGRRVALAFPSGRLYDVAGPRPRLLGDPQAPAEPWFLVAAAGAAVGISHFGALLRYDPETGDFSRGRLDNEAPGGNAIMFLETISPRCVLGANYSQQNLFALDPQSGAVRASSTLIARVTGEPMCAVGHGGKAYLGIYVRSLLSVYDPKKPFAYGKNPRELAELGAKYGQTRPRAAVTDGRRVYISSDSDYNRLGGALAVIDPATEQVEAYHHLLRDQNLPTLAWDPTTQRLWGGTDRWGQMKSHPPTQPSSLLYAFDPERRAVTTTLTPWPGADQTDALGATQGVLIARSGAEIALIATASGEILWRGTPPVPVVGRLRIGVDGKAYFLSEGLLYRWDLKKNEMTAVAAAPGCAHLTETARGRWLLADNATVYRVTLP